MNDPRGDRNATLASAFFAAVRRHGDRTASFDPDRRLTYDELGAEVSRRAEAMARAEGVSGARVAVVAGRSIDTVATMLATWTLGGAVVPIDPAWPAARRELVLADAEPALAVDALGRALPDVRPSRRSADGDGDGDVSAALVLYTSGSTGPPKGVVLGHAALLARLAALARATPFVADDVGCHRAAPTFVDAYAEVLGPLFAGVPCYVAPGAIGADELAAHGVTRLVIVPSLLAILLEACPRLGARAPALRLVVSSGEALSAALARRFRAGAPGVRLVNVYGSTEVAGDATYADVTDDDGGAGAGRVTVGRALDGVIVRLVDHALQEAERGGEGEIAIGGPTLARGYFRRDDLTRARFVIDPVSGERFFLTGDRARRLASGALDLVGRADEQVKIGGVRVELGEVERALVACDGVRSAAAAVRTDSEGHAHLVACAVATGAVTPERLRERLRASLPAAAVPAAIAIVAAVPKSAHGKIDRRAVAAMFDAAPRASGAGPREALWLAAALGRAGEALGPDETFEAAGGDSLARLRLLAALDAAGFSLSPSDLPDPLTPATLARAVASGAYAARARDAPPATSAIDARTRRALGRARDVEDARPISDFQRVMLMDALANPGACVWCDQLAFAIEGRVDPPRLEAAWRTVVARHAALRSAFAWRGLDAPLQIVLAAKEVPATLEVVDASSLDAESYRRRVLAEEWTRLGTTFDPERAPLFRIGLVIGPGRARCDLFFTYHHAVLDGESARAVLRDLLDAYAGRAPRTRPAFGSGGGGAVAGETQVRDAATRLLGRNARDGGEDDGARDDASMGDVSWRALHGVLAARAGVARLRTRARLWRDGELRRLLAGAGYAPKPYAGGDLVAHPLSAIETDAIRAWARARGASVAAVWIALFALHLARERGSRDVVFGLLLSGRDARTLDAVGMLANCLPLRVAIDPEDRFDDLVARVTRGVRELEAVANTPLLALCRAASLDPAVALETMFVSWSFADDATWTPPEGLAVSGGRSLTLCTTRLALVLSSDDDARMQLGVASARFHRAHRARLHLLALADAALAPAERAPTVASLLALHAPDGALTVAVPSLGSRSRGLAHLAHVAHEGGLKRR